jgi:hypothetical protein
MTDALDLARRFLSLWEDYLTALLSHPFEVEVLQGWVKAASAWARDRESSEEASNPGPGQAGPPADAAPAPSASGERGEFVAELAGRLARLEERLAAVERREPAPSRPRRRNRRIRAR